MFKAKLYAIFAGIIAVLLTTIKVLSGQNKRNKKRAERAEAHVRRASEIQESDTELSKDLSSRKAKIKQEIEDEKSVTSLSDPDNW